MTTESIYYFKHRSKKKHLVVNGEECHWTKDYKDRTEFPSVFEAEEAIKGLENKYNGDTFNLRYSVTIIK